MIQLRPANERGHADYGWLKSWHTFSFADYHDPRHTRFRSLRVINEDFVAPEKGFDTHQHKDMEILTYVLEGALEHRDSLGSRGVIRHGELQRMSAGTGVLHSEFNPSPDETTHLLQIWILPSKKGAEPSYDQQPFAAAESRGALKLIASGQPADAATMRIQQDVDLYTSVLAKGQQVEHELRPGRGAWLQIAKGAVQLNGLALSAGDGAAVEAESRLSIIGAADESEFLLFDLA